MAYFQRFNHFPRPWQHFQPRPERDDNEDEIFIPPDVGSIHEEGRFQVMDMDMEEEESHRSQQRMLQRMPDPYVPPAFRLPATGGEPEIFVPPSPPSDFEREFEAEYEVDRDMSLRRQGSQAAMRPPLHREATEREIRPPSPTFPSRPRGDSVREAQPPPRHRADSFRDEQPPQSRPRASSVRDAQPHPAQPRQNTAQSVQRQAPSSHPPSEGGMSEPHLDMILSRRSDLYKLKPYRYRPSKGGWQHIWTPGLQPTHGRMASYNPEERKIPCTQVRIITWNMDFITPYHEGRMDVALRHIEMVVLACKEGDEPEPCVILFQEVHASVLEVILSNPWVRRWFVVAPHTVDKWPEPESGPVYGNVTLIARSLDIVECHILHFGPSTMCRTAVCMKLRLHFPGSNQKRIISIVNTHLESMIQGTPFRPKQLELCFRFLKRQGVFGGVIAGDMNTISNADAMISKNLGLKDSWKKGDVESGMTWGFQGQNHGFPASRLDRIYYLPSNGYKVDEPRRIGVNLKIATSRDEEVFVSDHCGLDTTLRMLKLRPPS